jgi:hypothetical protein
VPFWVKCIEFGRSWTWSRRCIGPLDPALISQASVCVSRTDICSDGRISTWNMLALRVRNYSVSCALHEDIWRRGWVFPGCGMIKSGSRKFGLFLLKKRMRWNTNERSFVYPLLFSEVFLVPWTHLPVTGSKYPALQTNLFQHLKALELAYFCLLSLFFLLRFRFLHLKNFAWAHMWLLPNCFDILILRGFFLLAETKMVGRRCVWWGVECAGRAS